LIWTIKKFLFVIIHDITNATLQSNTKTNRLNYESFFNTINDLLFVLDFEGKIIHINQKVTDRLNFQPEELVGNRPHFASRGTKGRSGNNFKKYD
jgi:transcriptional regulator with PAS, ATPase and Fis domain